MCGMERILQAYIHRITHVIKHIGGPLICVRGRPVFRAGLDRINIDLPACHGKYRESRARSGGAKAPQPDGVQHPGCEKSDADSSEQEGRGGGEECNRGTTRSAFPMDQKEKHAYCSERELGVT